VHAVVVNVTIKDVDRAERMLENDVVPRASQAPGFVAGYWTRSDDNRGMSMLVFESEDAANGAAQMIQSQGPPDPEAVTFEGLEVREVIAHA
jgi:hypothetical protein